METDPHKKFIDHVKNGGRVLRIDSLNNEYQLLTINDINEIQHFGHNDLVIITDCRLSAVDMLALIFKQQKPITQTKIPLQQIMTAMNILHHAEIRPMSIVPEYAKFIYDIQDCLQYDFKIIITAFDNKEYTLEANLFMDDVHFIMNIYPQSHVIGPYKADRIYDDCDKAGTSWTCTFDESVDVLAADWLHVVSN